MDDRNKTILKASIVLLLGTNLFSLVKINRLSQDLSIIDNHINSINSNISSSIKNGILHLEEIQRQEASILSDFRYESGPMEEKRIDVELIAKPKEIHKDDRFYFSYREGEGPSQIIEAFSGDGVSFSSSINISIFDTVFLDFIIQRGDKSYNEALEPIYPQDYKYAASLAVRPRDNSFSRDDRGNFIFSVSYDLIQHLDYENTVSIRPPSFFIIKNGEVIEEIALEKTSKHPPYENRYSLELKNHKIVGEAGDEILFQLSTTDDNGLVYKVYLDGWKLVDDKKFLGLDYQSYMDDYRFMEIIIE